MQIRGVELILQFCLNLERSRAWYEDVLGVKAVAYGGGLFWLGNRVVHLAQAAPDTCRGGTGVYVYVDDMDAVCQELRARGYRFNEAPYDIPVGRLVTLTGPSTCAPSRSIASTATRAPAVPWAPSRRRRSA
jgi:catechol 2,3-dioxygenase-like lactoylglutathione lyase family enzyme